MEDIEWSPWIEHDGTDRCPEVAKELPCSIGQGLAGVLGGRGASIGRGWSWMPVNRYRIPMEDYRRITGMPSWDDAPDWARWLAQDSNGVWWFYELEPRANEDCDCWDVGDDDSSASSRSKGTVLGDWRDTLQARPNRITIDASTCEESISMEVDAGHDPLENHPDSEPDADQYTVGADTMTEHDTVNAPSHYASGEIECIDAIKASMTAEEFEGYCKGNVQKYMWRWRAKGGVESLRKAEWYLRRLIDVVE